MIWVILVVVIVIIAFKLGNKTGEIVSSANSAGGMRTKYAKLLEFILNGHPDSKIVVETRTYIRAGVSNYGGTTMFHIQQNTGNTVLIDYEVSNNPAVPSFTLHFSFRDDLDQGQMYEQICVGIQNKMQQLFGSIN